MKWQRQQEVNSLPRILFLNTHTRVNCGRKWIWKLMSIVSVLSVLWRVMSSFIDLIDCVSETLGLKWFLDLILADTVKTAKTLCWSYVTTQILKSNQGKQHESLACCCCCRWINVVEILVEGQPKWRKRHWFRDCFHICFLSHRSLKK